MELKTRDPNATDGHIRGIAAMSLFRRILSHTCEREGVELRVVASEQVPDCCPACGASSHPSGDEAGIVRCAACRASFDRDHHNAMRLLRFGLDLS